MQWIPKENVATDDISQERVDEMQKQRHEPVAMRYEAEQATPPQRKPLTDEQIEFCFYQTEFESVPPVNFEKDPERWCKLFARAIEAKLKEKNA